MTTTQCNQIAKHLSAGRTLTALDALRLYGCARAAARIEELRKQGMAIETRMITVVGSNGPARVAQYVMGRAAA